MKRSLMLAFVLCLTTGTLVHADELADLRAENARLKAENTQLKQRIGQLEQHNQQIQIQVQQAQAQAKQAQDQKLAHYLTAKPIAGGGKRVITFPRPLPVTRGKARHTSYQFTGTTQSDTVNLTIRADMSPGMFRTAKALELIVDGKPMDIAITDYESKSRRGANARIKTKLYDETVIINLTPQQMAQLAQADQITGNLGVAELGLGREDYNLLTVFAESLNIK
ncbi:MAG: hypothetical protein ACF8OB_04760 [Phycisphaeraceae bacterium JB051]